MLQESLLNSSDLNSPKHGFAVDHDMTISNLGRAQAYFIEHHCGKFGSDGKAKEDISYYDSLSDSFYFCAQGMELSHSVCIEDVAFQKMFFGILSANNLLVVSGTHRLTANKPAMLEGMYKAYDECFGPRRTYLKKQSDLKLQHEDNSKNSMLKRLKENNALESLTLIDDEPEFGENLEPMNEMGINFQLVKPPRSSDFENACDSEAKRYWLTPAARATRNQYMFDVLERELALGHMTLPGLKKSLDSLALAEGNSLALIVFNEFYQEKNTRELQRLCEADERLAMLTYSTRVGSISPLLMIPVYLLGAKMTVPSVAAPYLATVSIKTTAAMVGLVLGAITLAIANLAATAYLFKNSYNKTAATVGLLNAVGTGLIIFGSANLWNPIGWVTLGLAALVAVVGCIHAKSNKPAISNENTSRAKGGRALGGSPYSSFSRSSSVSDFNSISSTASTVSPASASPATSFDSHNSGADLKSVASDLGSGGELKNSEASDPREASRNIYNKKLAELEQVRGMAKKRINEQATIDRDAVKKEFSTEKATAESKLDGVELEDEMIKLRNKKFMKDLVINRQQRDDVEGVENTFKKEKAAAWEVHWNEVCRESDEAQVDLMPTKKEMLHSILNNPSRYEYNKQFYARHFPEGYPGKDAFNEHLYQNPSKINDAYRELFSNNGWKKLWSKNERVDAELERIMCASEDQPEKEESAGSSVAVEHCSIENRREGAVGFMRAAGAL